jgi:hypothetical protein
VTSRDRSSLILAGIAALAVVAFTLSVWALLRAAGDLDHAATYSDAQRVEAKGISVYDGGQYLLARLAPATPTDLADAVRGFANGLMDIGAAATAGAQNTDPEPAKRLSDADAASTRIGSALRVNQLGEK